MNLKPYVTLEEYNQMRLYIEDLEDALRINKTIVPERLNADYHQIEVTIFEEGYEQIDQAIKNSQQRKKKNA